MIFGLAYQFRFQIALMIAGYFLWLIVFKKEKFKNLTGIVLGFLLVIGWGYGLITGFTENLLSLPGTI